MFSKIVGLISSTFRSRTLNHRFLIRNNPDECFIHAVIVSGEKFNGFLSANVIIGNPKANDMETLFGPMLEGETIMQAPQDCRWPQLLKLLGIFSSVSQARKNGWDNDITEGWNEAIFKKQRKAVFVFKVTLDG